MCDDYIPVVDFASCGLEREKCSEEDLVKVGKLIVDAFSDSGFVYLKNYGITDAYIKELQNVTGQYFTSPLQDKLRYKRKGTANFGWVGTGEENPGLDPNIPCDYKEFFNINGASFTRDKSEWPDDVAPGFSHAILDFMERAQKLSLRILHALAIGLGLKDEYFFHKCHRKMHSADSFTTARTLYYPTVNAANLLPGQLRLGEHSDLTTISLVFQDNVGGLQKHRVVVKEGELRNKIVRRSLAYFVHPDNDTFINKPFEYKDESKNVPEAEQTKLLTSVEWIMEKMKVLWNTEEK